ncbi:MAG: phosphoadenosine phosphosulfate reductase family protein [Erysipelotrichaceae bacterium]|nr:phosphoadenosine phosphosulfate reductase family protein [Erysipelotrichaceae bacterium]
MDNELILYDRINVIRDIIRKHGEDKFYISFSGGKDSTILHYLIDEALPGNNIPRVYADTGIEYNAVKAFVKELQSQDERIEIIKPSVNIKQMLGRDGYPFKSKEHSLFLSVYQNSGIGLTVNRYLNGDCRHPCPKVLKYQFSNEFNLKISDKCCKRLKKEPFKKWSKENGKTIAMTGMMASEGGLRESIQNCIITDKDGKLKKFHPLLKVTEEWENWYIKERNIKLCKLYYPPYNFKRTGCKGCPYALGLQEQLEVMFTLMPEEYKQCEIIWEPVYQEYRRLNYRLKSTIQTRLL